jgi:outer membrane protein OmpA-like peptidoglycan-associated protein/tetratricopeptide (TPR) repeat protein
MKNILLYLLLFLVSGTLNGQMTKQEAIDFTAQANLNQLVKKNSELLVNGSYRNSLIVVDKLLELDATNANFNYRKGYALAQGNIDLPQAIRFLSLGTKSITKKYNASSSKEKSAPIDVYYHLANVYHKQGDIENARLNFRLYLDNSKKNAALSGYAQLGLIQLANAENAFKRFSKAEMRNLGEEVNAKTPEYAPVVSLDGSALYFTSRRLWENDANKDIIDPRTDTYLEDIYVSYRDFAGEWEAPIRLDFNEPNRNEATISVSGDEKRIYVYSDKTGNGDIYYSDFEAGRFNTIQLLEIEGVNTESWEPHVAITPDGRTIFFVSERKKGLGGRDIYRITKLPDGSWSLPANLGPTINGPYDEDSPFIAADGKTLYFSSNGEKSIGGFDIFVSVWDAETNTWSTPINLGYPINSTGDDLYYSTTWDGRMAYIASFRKEGHGEKDLYEIIDDFTGRQHTSVLKGLITVIGGKELPDDVRLTARCVNCAETNIRSMYPRGTENMFMSTLDKCREYELLFSHSHGETVFHQEKLNTSCEDGYEEIIRNVKLRLEDWKIIPDYDYVIEGLVADADTKNGLEGVNVEILDKNGKLLETLQTDENGNFTSSVLKDLDYDQTEQLTFRLTKDGYLSSETTHNLKGGDQDKIKLTLSLEKLDLGKDLGRMLALNTIYFDLNKSDIRPSETGKLDAIVKVLNENPTLRIELGSHTDCRASKAYNLALSNRRAQSTASYIKKRIKNPSRITAKGYGETQLVNNCPCEGDVQSDCSEEQHQLNRRTEFKITGL